MPDFEFMPLVHGSYNIKENIESILGDGLHAMSTSNITEVDTLLKKDNCVFLRYGRSRFNYGDGEILIIDPLVAKEKTPRIFLFDPQGVFNKIREYLSSGYLATPSYLTDVESVKEEFKANYDSVETFVRSAWFVDYLKSYETSWEILVTIFKQKFRENEVTLCDFFERHPFDQKWFISEEIGIPLVINPEYILAYWDKVELHEFRSAYHPDTNAFILEIRECLLRKH